MRLHLAFRKTYLPNEFHSIMRKTVHEWLEANHNGTGMAKKKVAHLKSLRPQTTSISQVGRSLQKEQARKTKISKRPK
jgi:hypothetical protein